MKKNRAINILISITAVFIVLCAAEIIMRLSWQMGGWLKRPIYQKSHNAYLRYELIPNAKSDRISINSNGFRGREYSIAKPAGTFRIIMLGDSETFSFLLKQEEPLASQLEGILNESSKSLHYEVFNFGVEGYNTFQELEQLKTKGLKFSPDLIILNYCLNDPEPGEYYFDKNFFFRHSALARYFSYRLKKALIRAERKRLNLRTEADHYYYLHQPKYFWRVENAICEIADIASVRGAKLILVIFPTSSTDVKDFKETYPYRALHKLIKGIQNKNIIFVDLIEEFNRLNLNPREVSINYEYNESHKNPQALRASANLIFNTLKSNKLIPD